jgi:hypothetical protein
LFDTQDGLQRAYRAYRFNGRFFGFLCSLLPS